jgi:hypothetical protein
MGVPAAMEPPILFLPVNGARHLVGISVGIGSHRRSKLLQIQMVMELGGYRPGAPVLRAFHASAAGARLFCQTAKILRCRTNDRAKSLQRIK